MARFRRRFVALVGAAAAVAALLGVPAVAPAGAASASGRASDLVVGYALDRPVCAAPADPYAFTCLAVRRVDVAKGTPGARRYAIPRWARGPGGGYTPSALATAYRFNPNRGGAGQVVGIVDWNGDPHIRADLNHFDRHYGLRTETSRSLRIVNENGRSAPLPRADRSAASEIALDVEAVRSVCHNCRILLVEANGGTAASLARAENAAVRLGATVVSNSFGALERAGHGFPTSVVRAFNHPGVVITASSGDDGYYSWDLVNAFLLGVPHTASFPASLPGVVAVGGTTLSLNSNGTRASEVVWNSNGSADAKGISRGRPLGASGGGCSKLYRAPSWQRGLSGYRNAGCGGMRLPVDVAVTGDPATGLSVYDSYGVGGWAAIGGTSLSSPIVAGMWALSGGARGMRTPSLALYQNNRFRRGALNDVTGGGNGWCGGIATSTCSAAALAELGVGNPNWFYGAPVDCSFVHSGHPTAKDPECNAVSGFDGPSGVGTPRGLSAFRTTAPSVSISASRPRHPRHRITFTGHVHRVVSGTAVVRKKWYWGDHTSPRTSLRHSVKHRYAKAGTYRVALRVTDNLGQVTLQTRHIRVR
jgi:subtilase family serine protease